jgi:hypothetical protein
MVWWWPLERPKHVANRDTHFNIIHYKCCVWLILLWFTISIHCAYCNYCNSHRCDWQERYSKNLLLFKTFLIIQLNEKLFSVRNQIVIWATKWKLLLMDLIISHLNSAFLDFYETKVMNTIRCYFWTWWIFYYFLLRLQLLLKYRSIYSSLSSPFSTPFHPPLFLQSDACDGLLI